MSMINPPIGEMLAKADCRYTLAVEAAKRARQLIDGSQPLINTKDSKPLVTAIEEIHRGLVTYERDDPGAGNDLTVPGEPEEASKPL